ncbi:MAG: dTMP kinase [Oscillospiraceae bacterium]|jgi:dTMP kinase
MPLIVLEGIDGAGKSTQFELLTQRLSREGCDFQKIVFPQYSEPSSALIRMYLGGEFGGGPDAVNAYAASAFFAVDRVASYIKVWGEYYRSGGLLVADRYTTSNAIHQGAKLPDSEKSGFFRWLFDFEYNLLGLPKPELVLYLDMPAELSVKLLRTRGGERDIHELDEEYLISCRKTALRAAREDGWKVISCAPGGILRSVDEIHEEIFGEVAAAARAGRDKSRF